MRGDYAYPSWHRARGRRPFTITLILESKINQTLFHVFRLWDTNRIHWRNSICALVQFVAVSELHKLHVP